MCTAASVAELAKGPMNEWEKTHSIYFNIIRVSDTVNPINCMQLKNVRG